MRQVLIPKGEISLSSVRERSTGAKVSMEGKTKSEQEILTPNCNLRRMVDSNKRVKLRSPHTPHRRNNPGLASPHVWQNCPPKVKHTKHIGMILRQCFLRSIYPTIYQLSYYNRKTINIRNLRALLNRPTGNPGRVQNKDVDMAIDGNRLLDRLLDGVQWLVLVDLEGCSAGFLEGGEAGRVAASGDHAVAFGEDVFDKVKSEARRGASDEPDFWGGHFYLCWRMLLCWER